MVVFMLLNVVHVFVNFLFTLNRKKTHGSERVNWDTISNKQYEESLTHPVAHTSIALLF